MLIREEIAGDEQEIARVVTQAFAGAVHSGGNEAAIIEKLRDANALSLSLVTIEDGKIVGYVAVSPVQANGATERWFGLGPVAVWREVQRRGIGGSLITAAIQRLKASGASGCVVVGESDYYQRFGFRHDPAINFADVPPPYLQLLSFGGAQISGAVKYHPAFY